MKHLRFVNLLIVMLMLTAWAPAPQMLATTPGDAVAALAAPVLTGPANGALVTGYRPTFTWSAPAYAVDSYDIQFSFDSYFRNLEKEIAMVNLTGTSYTPDFDLPSNSKIYWRVRAVVATEDTNWTAKFYIRTRPLPVAGVVGPTGGADAHTLRPLLEWTTTDDPLDGVLRTNKFDVQVRYKGGTIIKTASAVGSNYQYPSDLKRNTEYEWHVRSHGINGLSDFTAWQAFITPPNPPSLPVLTAPKNGYVLGATEQPVFTWKPSIGAAGKTITYIMQWSTTSKFQTIFAEFPDIPATTYTHTAPIPTGTYYWRVAGVDSDGARSNWSTARSFKTQPSLKVTVRDFLTKNPIAGADVTITTVTGVNTTLADGEININPIVIGSKTIVAYKADYIAKKVSTSTPAGVAREVFVDMVHIPMTVKLYWTTTQDLDLHAWIPQAYNFGDDADGGHIRRDSRGSTSKRPWVSLSADVQKGGTKPEVLTFKNRYPGDYVIAVYNFFSGGTLPESGAKIYVYRGTTLVDQMPLTVPATGSGRWWLALKINGATGAINLAESNIRTASPGPYDPDGGTYSLPAE